MKIRIVCLLIALTIGGFAMAQSGKVSGRVLDTNGDPLPGASVLEKGTFNGTVADIDGQFALILQSEVNAVLEVACLGFETQLIPVGADREFTVKLTEDIALLSEVVVVGYGTQKRSDLTGAVASVSSEKLKETIATNMDQMLQGKVAGVQITANSGAPGAATSIRVRGSSSINNSNEPLYIIDGIPFSGTGNEIGGFDWAGGTNGQKYVNPLSTIAPSDIVSIDILKDASATAIYGANGANGVILVTTKRGEKGVSSINYDGYVSLQQIGKRIDMMNLAEYAQYQIELTDFVGQPLDEAYADPSILGEGTDWQDEIFRNALMHSHQLSVSGGSDKVIFAASAGYMDQQGAIIGSAFNRFNARVNVDVTPVSWMKIGASLAFARTAETITNNDGTDGVILQALTMMPSIPVYDFDGNWAGPETTYTASQYNPVWLALMKNNQYNRNRVMGNFYLDLALMEGLTFRSEYGFDFSNNKNYCFVPTYKFGVISNDINQMLQRFDDNSYWIWKNFATWNRSFDQHTINVMLGTETSASAWSGFQIIKKNFASNDILVMTTDGDFVSNNGWEDGATTVSAFGRANYNYADRYLLTATMRADASSKFGKNNKWGYFPSAAFAWRLSNESFLVDNEVISNLKLRLGYGLVGSSNIGTYLYGSGMASITTPFGTAYRMENIANPDLRWEASKQYNVGVDLGLFNSRISLVVDLYRKETKDLLLQVSVPSYLGGTTTYDDVATPMVNIGKTQNQGVDITLNTVNIQKSNFVWTTDLVVSMNRNKVVALNDDSQVLYGKVDWYSEFQTATMIKVGEPIGVFYGYETDGIFKNEQEILEAAVQVEDPSNPGTNLFNQTTGVYVGDIRFKDRNEDGVINDADQTIIGDPNPDFTFGFNNNFIVGDFEIALGLTGSYGADILNFSRYRTESMTSLWDNQSIRVTSRAQVGMDDAGKPYLVNEGTDMPRPATNDFNRNNRMSDRFIEHGSYLRVQNLALTYNLPASLLKNTGLQNLKVYVNAQNLYTFTKYSGYDPEIGAYNQNSLMQNIDRGRYPSPRVFTFGVNVGF